MKKNAGSTMIVILMVLSTLSVCVVCSLNFTSVIARDVQRSNALRNAMEIADGTIDYAFAHWRETCRGQTNVQLSGSSFASIAMPGASLFPSVTGFTSSRGANPSSGTPYTLANYQVVAADQLWAPVGAAATPPPPAHGMGAGTANYHYLASADVTIPAMTGRPLTVKMRRIFTKSLMSPWNYAIFYVDDLEIHPGAVMNVTGWAHSNSKLYTSNSTLTFQSKASYGDDWEKNYKPGDSRRTSTAQPGPNWQTNLPPFRDQGQQPFGLDSTRIFSTADSSLNNDSYRELVERPSGSGTDPVAGGRYYNQAGIKITVDNAGAVTYLNLAGTVINASSAAGSNDRKLYDAFRTAIAVGATITDKREAATVRLVDVDVSIVNANLAAAGAPPFNGIVHISDTSGTASVKRAVRLKNGATITRTSGLTFATDNGLYIQGDYNTGRTATTNTPSNTGTPTSPTVAGYTRKPCAVLADAVMILSNSWVDSNSSAALASRVASATTVNTAIVSGIVPTAGGNYSGGAENFPRFLEDWSSKPFTYYGSMVELYPSSQFNSIWKNTGATLNVYNPPIRQWYFDTRFYSSPPPGTLTLVSYNKGRWFLE